MCSRFKRTVNIGIIMQLRIYRVDYDIDKITHFIKERSDWYTTLAEANCHAKEIIELSNIDKSIRNIDVEESYLQISETKLQSLYDSYINHEIDNMLKIASQSMFGRKLAEKLCGTGLKCLADSLPEAPDSFDLT